MRCVQNVLREGEGEEVDLSTAVCVRRVRVMARVVRPYSTCYTFKKPKTHEKLRDTGKYASDYFGTV